MPACRSGCLLARGDQLLLLALPDGGAQVQATLCSLENLADGGMRAKRIADVDLAGGFAVGRALAVGDAALLVVDGEMGARQLLRLDLGDGSTAPPQCEIGAVYALAPYTDERALICAGRQGGGFRFLAYDPAADSADVLGETDAWSGALACDPATGAAYCARDGAVCPLDLATGALGEAVATRAAPPLRRRRRRGFCPPGASPLRTWMPARGLGWKTTCPPCGD